MPDIGYYHPLIVDFVIAMLFVGVTARILSLFPFGPRFSFLGPMAACLIVIGSLATIPAHRSGHDAHGPAERVPGARTAVQDHEQAGEWTRNVFLGVAALELFTLLAARARFALALRIAAAVAGLVGLSVLTRASSLGGELVFAHAGGVGTRSGTAVDLKRLLVAGLFHNAQAARDSGRADEAARLTDELTRQLPDDRSVRLLGIESMIVDRNDPRAALAALAELKLPESESRLELRKHILTAQAYQAAGVADSAAMIVGALREQHRDNPRVQSMLDRIAR